MLTYWILLIKYKLKGPNYEFATYLHEDLFYNKSRLLENGDKWEPQLARNIEYLVTRR